MKSVFIILAALLAYTSSCPIGQPSGCHDLPNVTVYLRENELPKEIELNVTISTTKGHAFRPEAFEPALYTENMMSTQTSPNGCDGFFNFTSEDAEVVSACPWTYECDYDPQRIPAFLFHAHCSSDVPVASAGPGYCKEVYYLFTYATTKSCDPLQTNEPSEAWQLESKLLPVACNLISNL